MARGDSREMDRASSAGGSSSQLGGEKKKISLKGMFKKLKA
jgi:hypothetical protein